jgi:hypothetical protein
MRVIGAENGEQPRIQVGQGVYVFAVDALDPLAIFLQMPAVANTD